MSHQTQNQMVLDHLREHGDLSPAEGVFLYSIFRLAAVIKNLRAKGWDISTNLKQVRVQGVVRPYARYHFSEAQKKSPLRPIGKTAEVPQKAEQPAPTVGKGTPIVFQVDDQVKVTGAHKASPWVPGMEKCIGQAGIVESLPPEGNQYVRGGFGGRYFHASDLKLVHRKGTPLAEVRQLNEAHEVFYSSAREAGVL